MSHAGGLAGVRKLDVPITDSIAQRLTSLDASRKNIASLEGLQHFTALRRLIAAETVESLTARTGLSLEDSLLEMTADAAEFASA